MAGCFFKNPSEQKAWELIRKCSIKSQENVTISEIHANFIMNTKNASSFEIENFAKTIQANVFFNKNIKLESEIEIIGN